MMKVVYVALLALLIGVGAWFFAWDRDRAYDDPLVAGRRSAIVLDAAKAGKEPPAFTQPWYERNPAMFGVAVGGVVFVVGLLVVIASNSEQSRPMDAGEWQQKQPPATS
jgi:hypothetical protein